MPRIDLTVSDDDDDTTSYARCPLTSMHKIKLEPGKSDLTVEVKAEPMFVDLRLRAAICDSLA